MDENGSWVLGGAMVKLEQNIYSYYFKTYRTSIMYYLACYCLVQKT